MSWWKILIAVLIVLGVGAMTVGGLRDRPAPAAEVQLGKARKGPISRVVSGAGKVEAITELARWEGLDLERCWAYSDSASDLACDQEFVGTGISIEADFANATA